MYESFYGLKEKPFNITPDPDYLYMSQIHDDAYMHLQYALNENKGFVVITGEIGSGKTTLINFLLKNIRQDIHVGLINHASVGPTEFIGMVCQELELDTEGMGKGEMVHAVYQFLLRQFRQRKRVALIVDEAQNLPLETIEEIRMLSNLDTEKYHLLQMILVGQPELRAKLQRDELKQFAQRVTVHSHLRALDREEVGQYIQHRLKVAAAKNVGIFDKDAIDAIFRHSRGIPRRINVLCDWALLYGYADDINVIDGKVIEEVVREKKAAGFFVASEEDDQAVSSSFPALTKSPQEWKESYQTLERKINVLGKAMIHSNRMLTSWEKKHKRRDKVLIELFKLLQDSMKGRKATPPEYNQLKKQGGTSKTKAWRFASDERRLEKKK